GLYANVSLKRSATMVGFAPVPHSIRVSVTSGAVCATADSENNAPAPSASQIPVFIVQLLLVNWAMITASRRLGENQNPGEAEAVGGSGIQVLDDHRSSRRAVAPPLSQIRAANTDSRTKSPPKPAVARRRALQTWPP